MNARATIETDIVVCGGGLAGLAGALALAQAGFEVVVLDAAPAATRLDAGFDGRASAIAYANFRMLETLGVAARLGDDVQRIEEILVTDGRAPDGLRRGGPGPAFLHFDPAELDARPDHEPLGYMVENQRMAAALSAEAEAHDGVRVLAPARVVDVLADEGGAQVRLADGAAAEAVRARLVVGADGARSAVRAAAGLRVYGWSYPQAGVVATVRCARAHQGVAHEFFLPAGPFAILPLTDNRASLVWTERREAARAAMALDDAAFEGEVGRRFGDFLGAVTVEGPRWSYPLELKVAEKFIAQRTALIGDAARRIHPIAGQGFNLGLKDVAALAEVAADAARVGLDIGGADTLARYQQWRRFDSLMLAAATDVFNRLYSNDLAPVRLVRDAGMALVNRLPAARKLFMRDAGADLGELPKLLRGERLDA